jgi:hypothetical protein
MSSLATIRAAVRIDLHDDPASRWTDAVLNRHIQRAVREYSHFSPDEQMSTLTTAANSRNVDVSTLTPLIRIVAAEYPTGQYPPEFVPFTLWGETLTLDLEAAPSGTPNVNVYWHKEHAINGSVTFPSSHDDIIATGAAGYAALDLQSYTSNKVNTSGSAFGEYQEFGAERLRAFAQMLRALPQASRVKVARLYTPVEARFKSQTTDPGPV